MLVHWYSPFQAPKEALLEREHSVLGMLIARVRRDPQLRLNAVEHVNDIYVENVREAVNGEEDQSPPPSADSPTTSRNIPDVGSVAPVAGPSCDSTQRTGDVLPFSRPGVSPDSQESRVYPLSLGSVS